MGVDGSSDDLLNPGFYKKMKRFDTASSEGSDFNPLIDDDSPVFVGGEVFHDEDIYDRFGGVDSDFDMGDFDGSMIDDDSPVLDSESGVVRSVDDLSASGGSEETGDLSSSSDFSGVSDGFNPMIDDDSPVFVPDSDGSSESFLDVPDLSESIGEADESVLPSADEGSSEGSTDSIRVDGGTGLMENPHLSNDFNPLIDGDSPVFVPDSSSGESEFSTANSAFLYDLVSGEVGVGRGVERSEVKSEEVSASVSERSFNPMIDEDSPIFVPDESTEEAFSVVEEVLKPVEESIPSPSGVREEEPGESEDQAGRRREGSLVGGVEVEDGTASTVDPGFVNPMIDDDSPVFRESSKPRPSPLVSDISTPSSVPPAQSPVSEGDEGGGRDQVRVSRMRSEGVFRAGREVKPGEWNEFDEDRLDVDGLSVGGLTDDAYSGAEVSREFGVPADGLSGGVGERYVERAEFKKGVKPAPRHEGLESDFNHSSSLLVSVDGETGVPSEVQRSFIDRYGERDSERLKNVSESLVSSRINKEEIRFFRNLGHSKKGFMDADSLLLAADVDTTAVDEEELEKSKRRINRALGGAEALRSEAKFSFTHRDREILAFLAMFKYANAGQLARMFSADPISVRRNLRRMEKSGLVRREKVVNTAALWFLTDAGMLLSGFDLPRTTKGRMNWSMFPHQFTVNYVAANLWGANLNVLNLEDFPSRNRLDIKGEPVFGEELLSELAVQSSFGKFKQGARASVYKPQLLSRMSLEFDEWRASGGMEFGESPEFFEGNEWMWVLFETGSELNYHVPDLVVKRGRGEDGSPKSIAVEVELMNKDWDSYMRTLKAYQTDTRVYDKVVWVCKGLGTAEKLEKVAKTIGLWQEGRISITPVLTEDGVFKGDLWTI